jgi:hypothetical protein
MLVFGNSRRADVQVVRPAAGLMTGAYPQAARS